MVIRDGKGGMYSTCWDCGSLIKLNKLGIGSLHLCAAEPYTPPPESERAKAKRIRKSIRRNQKVIRKAQKHCCCTSIGDSGYHDLNGVLISCRIHPRSMVGR